jgi:hypothetical protein
VVDGYEETGWMKASDGMVCRGNHVGFRGAQMLMGEMIRITLGQLKDAEQDILHNRLCAALAYRIAVERQSPPAIQKLAVAADVVHNIAKEDKNAILSNPALFADLTETKARTRGVRRRSGCMTKNPKALGFFSATGCVIRPELRSTTHNRQAL